MARKYDCNISILTFTATCSFPTEGIYHNTESNISCKKERRMKAEKLHFHLDLNLRTYFTHTYLH